MLAEPILVTYHEESQLEARMARLCDFAGAPCAVHRIYGTEDFGRLLTTKPAPCVIVSGRSLAALFSDAAISREAAYSIFSEAASVLVFGVIDNPMSAALGVLTNGLVSSVVACSRPSASYQVSSSHREITREFTGLTFGAVNEDTDCGFILNRDDPAFSSLVSIAGRPIFGMLRKPESTLFLSACGQIVDLDSPTDGTVTARKYFSHLAPVLMFLKHVFKDRVWHNPNQCASLVIDDPLLRRSYGFLDYARLLEEMDGSGFCSTIAFIPWNYRRTDTAAAQLFRARGDRFDLCIHGCDHTGGEFASVNVEELHGRVRLATWRMREHEQRTGLPCTNVMVFPQGRFSAVSLGVLKSHNFLAAVNSTVKAEDLGNTHGLTLADMLSPALLKYSNFPLFSRRYPREIADFALDLFVGKPALLVEHHGYFKEGYDRVREFAAQLNALSPQLQWMGIGQVVQRSYLQRVVSPDKIECRIFANRQIVQNTQSTDAEVVMFKPEASDVSIKRVSVNGRPSSYRVEDGYLQFHTRVSVDKPASVAIDYVPDQTFGTRVLDNSIQDDLKGFMRRHLSEFRDNYLSRHERLLSLAYRVKNIGMPLNE